MSTIAQMSDLCAVMKRAKPLHVVAEARGPLLEDFTNRLQQRRASLASNSIHHKLVTSDVLPTEELAAGFMAQCGMQPKLSVILKVRSHAPSHLESLGLTHCQRNLLLSDHAHINCIYLKHVTDMIRLVLDQTFWLVVMPTSMCIAFMHLLRECAGTV